MREECWGWRHREIEKEKGDEVLCVWLSEREREKQTGAVCYWNIQSLSVL